MSKLFDPFGIKDDVEKKLQENQPPAKQDDPPEEGADNTDYKLKYERLKALDVAELDDLLPIILEEEGDDISVKIKRVASGYKESKTKLTELEKKEQDREQWFRENQILHSSEFKDNYEKPVVKSLDLYNTLLGEYDAEGKPKRDEAWVKFRKAIFNEGNELTAPQIKAVIKSFSDQYHQKFGEAPDVPSIKQIMDARDDLIDAQINKVSALQNWSKEQELRKAQQKNELDSRSEEIKRAQIAENKEKLKEYKAKIKYDELTTVLEKEQIEAGYERMGQKFEDAMTGKEVPSLDEYFELLHKATLFDDLMEKSKGWKSVSDDVNKGRKPIGQGGPPEERQKQEESGTMMKIFKLA